MSVNLHAVGQSVKVADDIQATVRFVRFGPATEVTYLVAWWHDGRVHEEWIPAGEILSDGICKPWRLEQKTPPASGKKS